MLEYSSSGVCPCGSGITITDCCVPTEPPIGHPPNAWQSLRLGLVGETEWGEMVDVYMPPGATAQAILRQPHQIDIQIDALISETIGAVRKSKGEKELLEKWLLRLEMALYAFRYHERQFLYRMRSIRDSHRPSSISGSLGFTLKFEDFPLRFELEACLIRVRACLDAASGLLTVCLGRKQKTFGELCQWISAGNSIPNAKVLQSLLRAQEAWLSPLKGMRDTIVHKGRIEDLSDIEYNVSMVSWPKIGNTDADEFIVNIWRELPRFATGLIIYTYES